MAQTNILSTFLLIGLLVMATIEKTGAQIGVCYGMLGNDLPSKQEVIDLFKQNNIQRMRIYDPNQEALQALRGTNIELILDLPNSDLQKMASSQPEADTWVQNNIQNYNDVNIKYIAVGNEVDPNGQNAQYLFPAMQNIQNSINKAGLTDRVKVSTSLKYDFIGDGSFPPSKGSIRSTYKPLFDRIIEFLNNNRAPLLVNLYPYFSYSGQPNTIPLDYALFTASSEVVHDDGSGLGYQNLFDAMLDTAYFALEKVGGDHWTLWYQRAVGRQVVGQRRQWIMQRLITIIWFNMLRMGLQRSKERLLRLIYLQCLMRVIRMEMKLKGIGVFSLPTRSQSMA
uniref:glucan endo-1,3-beta-D-glucosidase n=1 Tax=Cannabis sativa TaxID=3483 RepID=A0A803R190_CANSA